MDSVSGPGRSPGVGNGNPLQYSCLENPMDRGVWWATVHVVAESDTTEQLEHIHKHTHTHIQTYKIYTTEHLFKSPASHVFHKSTRNTLWFEKWPKLRHAKRTVSEALHISEVKVAQSCLTLCNPVDCSLLDSSVHRILQARMLEWLAIPFCGGSSQPRDRAQVSCIVGGFFTI